MHILHFIRNGSLRLGIYLNDKKLVLDITDLRPDLKCDSKLLLKKYSEIRDDLTNLINSASSDYFLELDLLTFYKPIIKPEKIIGVGLNYLDHAQEVGKAAPDFPVLFARFDSSLVAHRDPINYCSSRMDFEGEIAIIIGKDGKNIDEKSAKEHIGAYSIFNDVTARDYQAKSSQWLLGKNFDCSGSIGPFMVTQDDLGDSNLTVTTSVNNIEMQRGSSSSMIFSPEQLISTISKVIFLRVGDIIATGTPSGVGYLHRPPRYLQKGDICTIEIEPIGKLSNIVI